MSRGCIGGLSDVVEPVKAPKVCLDCALSSVRLCRYHAGETPWMPEPLMVDPATAIAERRARAARHRARSLRVWAWAAVILAANGVVLLLGLI